MLRFFKNLKMSLNNSWALITLGDQSFLKMGGEREGTSCLEQGKSKTEEEEKKKEALLKAEK